MTRNDTPGAVARSRATRPGSSASRCRSLAAIVKVARQLAGFELAGRREALQFAQQLSRARRESRRPRRRADAPAGFHEQRVADDGAQLVEQMADSRLRHAERLRRACDRAGVDDGDQQPQQAAVEVQFIDFAHESHDNSCVDFWQWPAHNLDTKFEGGANRIAQFATAMLICAGDGFGVTSETDLSAASGRTPQDMTASQICAGNPSIGPPLRQAARSLADLAKSTHYEETP